MSKVANFSYSTNLCARCVIFLGVVRQEQDFLDLDDFDQVRDDVSIGARYLLTQKMNLNANYFMSESSYTNDLERNFERNIIKVELSSSAGQLRYSFFVEREARVTQDTDFSSRNFGVVLDWRI